MAQPRRLRLLIIDDSADDTELLVRHLTRGGYELTYERVDTPLALTAVLAQQWDLVVCDYSMPSFTGTEALKLLRSTGSEVPFIFVSGQIGEDKAVAALRQGAQDYVMKNNVKRLIPAVERELREAEQREERKTLERQVKQLEKFEAIGQLAGGIAHDFNNVIGAVLALAQLGLEEAPSGSRLRERFQKIGDQASYAAGLTAQLLAFARRQILQRRNLNLNEVVSQSASLLQTAIGHRIEFHSVLAPDLLPASADPTQMKQILINLCLNARDAMPQGGRLSIETRNVTGSEPNPDSSQQNPVSYVLLTVSDTGIGMDAATLDRIFEPFFTTKEVGHGTGLGLATVYGIVNQHGGSIKVASEPGRGTCFEIRLPAVPAVLEAPQAATVELSDVKTGTATILVAEDHEGLAELAYEILSPRGYRVILAHNGEEALRLFKANQEEIQLAILDVVMPRLGGVEAYKQMRDIKRDLPVIFTTGHTEESAAISAYIREGAVFLPKPYTPDQLGSAVRSTLRKLSL